MPTAIKTNDPFYTPPQAWDFNADLIDLSLVDVTIPSNGILRTLSTDAVQTDNPIPFFPDFVISGILLSIQAPPNALTVDFTTGSYQINATVYNISPSGSIAITAGDAVNPRRDIIYVTTTSTVIYLAGTPSANPVAPTLPANSIKLADIYVIPNAVAASIGAYLTINNTNIVQTGVSAGQTLFWDSTSQNWIPGNALQTDGLTVGITTAPSTESLTIDGRIQLSDAGAPMVTTDKLYNDGGNLFFNGIQLNTGTTIAAGTTSNSVLKWNGAAWVEDATTLISSTGLNISTKFMDLDSIAAPASPISGARLYVNANDAYIKTPTKNIPLTLNGGLPSGSIGQTLRFASGIWNASSDILNDNTNVTLSKTSGSNVGSINLDNNSILSSVIDATINNYHSIDLTKIESGLTNGTNNITETLSVNGDYVFSIATSTLSVTETIDNSLGLYNFDAVLGSVSGGMDFDLTTKYFNRSISDGTNIISSYMNLTPSTKYFELKIDNGSTPASIQLQSDGDIQISSTRIGFYGEAPVAQASAFTATDPYAPNTGDVGTDTLISNLRTMIGELKTVITNLGFAA